MDFRFKTLTMPMCTQINFSWPYNGKLFIFKCEPDLDPAEPEKISECGASVFL